MTVLLRPLTTDVRLGQVGAQIRRGVNGLASPSSETDEKGRELPLLVDSLGSEESMLSVGRVDLLLEGAHLALDDLLDLVRKLALDVLLESTEKERSKDFVKTTNDEELFLFVDVHLVRRAGVGERGVEPLIERLDRVEDLREDKVEESPELRKVVLEKGKTKQRNKSGFGEEREKRERRKKSKTNLKRRSRQDESVPRRVVLTEGDRELALGVLHSMTFVDDHVDPLDLTEERLFSDDVLERRDEDLEVTTLDSRRGVSSSLGRALVDDGRDGGRPLFELERPVGDGRERDDDEVRALLLLGLDKKGDEG
jgi:hypothetical protein